MNRMLHIVSISTGHAELFARIGQGDAVIFIGGAVLSLHKNATHNEPLLQCCQDRQCYVLVPDLHLRGLAAIEILAELTLLNYPEFVQLTIAYDVIKTWS